MQDAVSNRPIFKRLAADARPSEDKPGRRLECQGGGDSRRQAAARARGKLFDFAACNEFPLFVTLTLDQSQVDRYDYKTVVRKMGHWLDNLVRRHGFAYLIVPELHKDGAVHFHGLVREEGLTLLPAGRRDKSGRPIFNVSNWRFGFTTAVRLSGDYGNVCKYITKYIGKGVEEGTIGGRYFFHGGNLLTPVFQYYDADFSAAEGKEVSVEGTSIRIIYKKI